MEVSKAPSSSGLATRHPPKEILETWHSANAVCFDVDSTVCLDEGIVELADFCGAGQAVAGWKTKQLSQFLGYVSCLAYNIFQKTNLGLISLRAMTGTVPFDEALAAWISLRFLNADFIKTLKANNIEVFLVSGGIRQMIK
ncbi:hypothetical protein TRIUR3_01585 [Triticum urartu]|uniref:phosphoserine phosphatase n=1 Tax=Triticum urartu TaxID=4572 RepID=M7Z4B8_TRIUA|nr:hypothetical protein TRIUR3_01585 [Triticum urartu]